MKILIDARTLGCRPSGIGIYINSFIRELSNYPDVEISLVSDVCESMELKKWEKQGISIALYGRNVAKSISVFGYFKYVQKEILKQRPQIFWEPNNLMPIKLINPYGKLLVTVHDLFPITTPEYFSLLYRVYFRIGVSRTLNGVDGILYDSEDTRREAERYFPGVMKKKSKVAYVVVDALQEERITDQDYFLYVGNLERRKGVDILLEAYRRYKADGGTLGLCLAGKVREDIIGKLLKKSQAESGITYVGYISEEEKRKLYAQCSCFVFPSKAEGFGIPPIEVMNYNKPIIVSGLNIFYEILGGCVNYFELSEDDRESVNNLTQCMKTYCDPNMVQYCVLKDKYSGKRLGRELYEFIKML